MFFINFSAGNGAYIRFRWHGQREPEYWSLWAVGGVHHSILEFSKVYSKHGWCDDHQRGLERDREGARHQGRSAGGEAGGHSCDGRGEDATLAISGQRSKEQVQKMDFWHSAERSTGPFIRKFTMPENAVLDRVTAKEANGVLTVIVPKLVARGSQPRRIELGTSGGAENRPGSSTSGACDRTHWQRILRSTSRAAVVRNKKLVPVGVCKKAQYRTIKLMLPWQSPEVSTSHIHLTVTIFVYYTTS